MHTLLTITTATDGTSKGLWYTFIIGGTNILAKVWKICFGGQHLDHRRISSELKNHGRPQLVASIVIV